MATLTFLGTGTGLGKFTVDDIIISSPLIKGERRLYSPFPYPTLEIWRRHALVASASIFELPTQCRTTVLFAHEADMGTMFYELTQTDPAILEGHYNYKKKAILAEQELSIPLSMKAKAFAELKQQNVPDQHVALIQQRVDSESFAHRVTGVCAAVYLTALLLEEAEARQ
jgi:hypothetical protein